VKIINLFVIFLCFVWFLRKYGMFLDLGIKSTPPHNPHHPAPHGFFSFLCGSRVRF